MTVRTPLVLADDGLIQQLQSSDSLPNSDALAQILIQNNAIIRLAARIAMSLDADDTLADEEVEQFISEFQS